MRRPFGITVLGALVSLAALIMVLIGIASFFVGLAFLIPGTPISGTELVLNGILYFFIGVALCIADSDERTTPFEVTAPFGYFRLRRAAYEEHTLREWADRIAAAGWENAFVYFKHEERGTGPRFAEQFRTMAVPEGAST